MPTPSELIARAKSADKIEAHDAFKRLLALGPEARGVEIDLRPMLNDDEPRRALGARALLATLGDEDAELHIVHLIERSASGKGDERSVAGVYLRELDAPVVVPALLRVLSRHQRPAVRAKAASLAGSTVGIRAAFPVDALIDALADVDQKVRVAAIMSVVQHLAPTAPAKPSATMTPARHARLQPLVDDEVKAVADVAKRLFARLET
jgi:HEAT repeat protein